MGNMSYCRFQNTVTDLADCQENIWNDDISEDEKRARKRLIQICKEITGDFEDVDE